MKRAFLGWLALAVGAMTAQAQCCPGPLWGRVTDATGKPIQNAEITAHCGDRVLAARSDAAGKYQTAQLPYGRCEIAIAAKGFHTEQKALNSVMDGNNETNVQMQAYPEREDAVQTEGSCCTLGGRDLGRSAATSFVAQAAKADWEYGAFAQGGVGLEDRTNFGFFALGVHAGHMLSGPIGSGVLQGVPEYSVEVMPVWQSYTPKFPQLKCPTGATLASQCYGPVTAGGTYRGVSITPIQLRWNFTHGERLMPWVQAAGGVVYTTRKYPGVGDLNPTDPTQTGPNADTSVWNFTPQGGIGVHYFTGDKRSVDAAVNAVHISSASLGDKNPGVNVSLMFSVGYTWWK